MKNIKHIIVATDFSATSRGAYRYAKELADSLKASITLVHVKESLNLVSDIGLAPFTIYLDDELKEQMQHFIIEENKSINKETILSEVKTKVINGNAVDVLVNLSQQNDVDLIVIGTTGLSDVLTKLFGSVSLTLSHKAECPVLLIPRDVKWQGIEQLLYATNYESKSKKLIHEIASIAENFKADVHFLNIKDFNTNENDNRKEVIWDELLSEIGSNIYFETHTIFGNDKIEQFQKFCQMKNISIIVFASKYRRFWERFSLKSITDNMALTTNIPMMVIHIADN